MKKIAIISDIHGNLQVLEAIIKDIKSKRIDAIICLGDTIAIGPNPKECMEIVMKENITTILGNHEEYFLEGTDSFSEVVEGEKKHQRWIKSRLNKEIRDKLEDSPYIIEENIEGINFAFTHYARKEDKFIYIKDQRTVDKLDSMFSNINADVIFYGHEHDLRLQKLEGEATYICVGSSGCTRDENTYYTLVNIEKGKYNIEKVNLRYNRARFIKTFNDIDYPDKNFIGEVFFGIKK